MRWRTGVRAVILAVVLAGCEQATEPEFFIPDGWLVVDLVSPHQDDGGLLFTVTGARVDSVRLPSGYQAAARQVSASSWRVLLTGNLVEGTVGRIFVPDVRRVADYRATIEQVAARGTYVQRDPSTYALRIRTP